MSAEENERRLFREAVANATPIKRRAPLPRPPRPKAEARFRLAAEREALAESRDDPRDPDEFGAEPDLAYAAPGVQHRVLRRLRRGQIPEQGLLDLHGKTQAAAHEELAEFLTAAGVRGLQCVRIVHGKGHRSGPAGPVLKRAVARWLARRNDVLAYTSARPVDGGTGAVYVLLRRRAARASAIQDDARTRS
ncbi:MAG TPA: Smr/MutS family protein [Gammaproteobacteria bacterium]|nr:Smr/MutS family protein [Gammaproteobacteria bacterium]